MPDPQKKMRPIWIDEETGRVKVIDQRQLPHRLEVLTLHRVVDVITAIQEMVVRGAPLIGVTAAWGIYVALTEAAAKPMDDDAFSAACRAIRQARPTAVNLMWAVDRMQAVVLSAQGNDERVAAARDEAARITEEEATSCRHIGSHGANLIQKISIRKKGAPVNILTHCNAGWLACVEYGTATAPIYTAFDQGLDLHVWVDETRPLNQGARLTAWELGRHGVPHTVITDNAGGHLMQHGEVDLVIVGTDRTTHTGDVANKIGTYLKALAAFDNQVPFYVALPSSTFDWELTDGIKQIPIETRDPDEVRYIGGLYKDRSVTVLIPPASSPADNYAFDVTPARLVTGFITERGLCAANKKAILDLFPEKRDRSKAELSHC